MIQEEVRYSHAQAGGRVQADIARDRRFREAQDGREAEGSPTHGSKRRSKMLEMENRAAIRGINEGHA
jgi:hypothetical protein